ncbi:alpha/beta fold hydrolase [Streptomyces tremellae]|uniref:AB hydrolase-1 domain-containing protein n=1 Tax=Streptomyces tremellae TaxID=1124239 RepID=A0ABP7FSZ5_9ACTN
MAGAGPLIAPVHSTGDSGEACRQVTPPLVAAGHRAAAVDLRGLGGSRADWPEWSRTAVADDLLAVIRHLGGPAVLVGHSVWGGGATVVAALEPSLITAVAEIAPRTREQSARPGDSRAPCFRRGTVRLLGAGLLGSRPSRRGCGARTWR